MPTRKAKTKLDAIAMLKEDHRRVEELFEKYEKSESRKAEIAKKICLELTVHATLEEEIFYPACQEVGVEKDMLDEALVEHDGAKVLIAELSEGSPEDDFFDAKVKVLSEEIKHHVKEEEADDGIFAKATASDLDMELLGKEMAARKAELLEEFGDKDLPPPITRTMKDTDIERGRPVE